MTAEEVIQETAKLCRSFQAHKVILYGSRTKHTARERSDMDRRERCFGRLSRRI